jgi:carbon-monoxide dehydrogenase medium subunit
MKNFTYAEPKDLASLYRIKKEEGKRGIVLAGSTNLMVYIKDGKYTEGKLIDIGDVAELRGIEKLNGAGEPAALRIGAGETIASLLESDTLQDTIPFLRDSMKTFANPLVRNMSTIGGNIADASPIADTAPVLLVLEGRVVLGSAGGERTVPVEEFFTGPGTSSIRKDEVLHSIVLPIPKKGRGGFVKLRLRHGTACSVASAAVWLAEEDRKVEEIRIAFGGVAPKPVRAYAAEKLFTGKVLDSRERVEKFARTAQEEISPITDVRAGAEYRKQVSVKLLVKAVMNCLETGGSA